MWFALVCSILSIIPPSAVQTEVIQRIDFLEKNFVYNFNGELVFTQLIFWGWNSETERFEVLAWRKYDATFMRLEFLPNRLIRLRWLDGDVQRLIISGSYCETHYMYDNELEHRSIVPPEKRKGLKAPKSMKK